MIKNLSNRISWLTSRMGSMSVTNLEERLYGVLTNVAHEHGAKSQRGFVIEAPCSKLQGIFDCIVKISNLSISIDKKSLLPMDNRKH